MHYEADGHVDGLFVLNRFNALREDVPRLPMLLAETDGCYRAASVGVSESEWGTCPIVTVRDMSAFDDGDVLWLDSRHGLIKSVLSKRANANTVLVTERCDNLCKFCSQPPNDRPDTELYLNAALAILNFNSDGYVGISGGEPTFNRSAFVRLLRLLSEFRNRTKLHILTNGRSFADPAFTREVAQAIDTRPVLWGVPLYGHESSIHDPLVGAKGAFVETVNGLLNLCGHGQSIELRIVPSSQNLKVLPDIVRFVVTSYSSIRLISIMNLEPKGWARTNYESLYVNVRDQAKALQLAADIAVAAGREVRLFNYPLCLLPEELRCFAVKSISDWKNYYPIECEGCRLMKDCGGFFASAVGRFREAVEVQR